MNKSATIYVVDDDESIRRALSSVGQLLGYPVESFDSAEQFLIAKPNDPAGCLVLDLRMPGMSGLELQRRLVAENCLLPIVMISGHADVRLAVEAMTLGAMTLLEKPFGLDELSAQVRKAIQLDEERRSQQSGSADRQHRLAALTPKEQEVLRLIGQGLTNREMAEQLGLSVRAVEDRRSRLMKKVQADSVADLVRLLIEYDRPR